MDKLIITGGRPLSGEAFVNGAKNAALPALAATLLASGHSTVNRVPPLRDVQTMCRLLEHMGAKFDHRDSSVNLDTSEIKTLEAPYELVKTMRASVLVLCPLVARYGRARVSLPGGCAIGARPINFHLMGLEKMGAKITLEEGYVTAVAKRLKGARITFDVPTVTGTENLMMAAALARGTTVLENAAREPEVIDLAHMLQAMGARIEGVGTGVLTIEGVDELQPVTYAVIADRIETGTFMAAAAITGGTVTLKGAQASHLDAVVDKFRQAGVIVTESAEGLTVSAPRPLRATDITTTPYPGFPTDMQAQFMAMMCLAKGSSVVTENIFENRFMHVAELRRMGADITTTATTATVKGVKVLKGATVMATDLRASASLVVAGLAASGTTVVERVYHLDRGYHRIEQTLRKLGATIERVSSSQ